MTDADSATGTGPPDGATAPPPPVQVFRAERAGGPEGAVERHGEPLTDEEAITALRSGEDIVVCGPERRPNRNKARTLADAAFGSSTEEAAHERAGRMALPHFHDSERISPAHAFYESPPRHSRRRRS